MLNPHRAKVGGAVRVRAERAHAKKPDEKKVRRIVRAVVKNFRSFGRGSGSAGENPVARALRDAPPCFAGGVNIEEVVRFILSKK